MAEMLHIHPKVIICFHTKLIYCRAKLNSLAHLAHKIPYLIKYWLLWAHFGRVLKALLLEFEREKNLATPLLFPIKPHLNPTTAFNFTSIVIVRASVKIPKSNLAHMEFFF